MGENDASDVKPATGKAGRMVSVDALRGFDMFWIVGAAGIVRGLNELDDGGLAGILATQLRHASWVGFRFYDLIFPLFVFLVGMSVVFSLQKLIDREGRWAAYKRIFRRFLLLYLVGIFYYGGFANAWPGIRLVGVLQRLALCYLFTGLLYCHLRTRGLVVTFFVCLLGYWALMSFVPAPGQETVSFEPEKNLANYVDLCFLPGRMNDGNWDPEGLLSTIPAVASCLLGVFASTFLRRPDIPDSKKMMGLVAAGVLMVGIGFLWGMQFPVIKKIWTSSYVLVAGGYSCLLLAFFYTVVDMWGFQWWARPFIWVGSNALAVYLGCNLVNFRDIADRFVGGDVARMLGSYDGIVREATGLLLVLLVARFLYRRQIFLRL